MADSASRDSADDGASEESWPCMAGVGDALDEDSWNGFHSDSSASRDTEASSTLILSSDSASLPNDSESGSFTDSDDNAAECPDKNSNTSTSTNEEAPYSGRRLMAPKMVVEALLDGLPFQNASFEIRPDSLSGAGGFALRDLAPGEVVLREQPILRSDYDTLYDDFGRLGQREKKVFLQLYGSDHFEPRRPRVEAIWSTNWFAQSPIPPPSNAAVPSIHPSRTNGRRGAASSFSISPQQQGLFAIGSRLNHACSPAQNIEYEYDPAARCMVFSVGRAPVRRGDELTISYGRGLRPIDLYRHYGFQCACGACAGLTDEEIEEASVW